VATTLDGLTGAQRKAVDDRATPLLIDGVPGAGKTEVLVRRFCALTGADPGGPQPMLLVADQLAAESAMSRIEAVIAAGHASLPVHSTVELCERLLAAHSFAAGIEDLTPVLTAGERLALLLENAGSLELRHHDFRGRPLALFAAFVRRIDQLKAELVDAERFAERSAAGSDRDREFAAVFRTHDRLLRERGVLDRGDGLIACVRMLEREPAIACALASRHPHLLVDDWQRRSGGERELVLLLARSGMALTLAGDDLEAAITAQPRLAALADELAPVSVVRLEQSLRCPPPVLAGARAIATGGEAVPHKRGDGARAQDVEAVVRFWRCKNARAQAQHVAAEIEGLLRAGLAPGRCAVLVRSVTADSATLVEALDERGIEYHVSGAGAFFERTEVRDVLAWLRLLVDPRDAAAVVRALARPPIELHSVDIARCVQIARRRKVDVVAGLGAALESPLLPPEARERVALFMQIHRASAAAFDEERADLFVHRLIERLGLRRHQLFSASPDVAERIVSLGQLSELATRHAHAVPGATPREFATYAAAVAESGIGDEQIAAPPRRPGVVLAGAAEVAGQEFDHVFLLSAGSAPPPRATYVAITRTRERLVVVDVPGGTGEAPSAVELARAALGAAWEEREEELYGPTEALQALFGERRDELLDAVARVGARLGELRFDTDLDVTHAVVRLLELIKLAALLERRDTPASAAQSLDDALADVNARLSAAATPLEREILSSSPLDATLVGAQGAARSHPAAREEPSLAAFLPRRGDGLVLSASDIDTYRSCPLRYKFARVFRIPREPTLNQRFGILVHQVLERFHEEGAGPMGPDGAEATPILRLLDIAWRRSGLGDSAEELQLREKARAALLRYAERDRQAGPGAPTPRWFERSFSFPLGSHLIRGRVDRIDELPGGGFELIDYKTGLPRQREQLRGDVQLALYAVAAREAWNLDAAERTYYYVLDDIRVTLSPRDEGTAPIAEVVERAGEAILAERFEPTPSRAVCSMCDYRIACPAAEK